MFKETECNVIRKKKKAETITKRPSSEASKNDGVMRNIPTTFIACVFGTASNFILFTGSMEGIFLRPDKVCDKAP